MAATAIKPHLASRLETSTAKLTAVLASSDKKSFAKVSLAILAGCSVGDLVKELAKSTSTSQIKTYLGIAAGCSARDFVTTFGVQA